MKNNLKSILLIFSLILNFQTIGYSNDQFKFNVTEIEILNNGKQINGYKGGTVSTENGDIIKARNFYYDKINNILEVKGDVNYKNLNTNTKIISENLVYYKNEEKIVTKGNSKALDNKNIITADEFNYDKLKNIINAKKNVEIEDLNKNIKIFSDDITYYKNEEKIVTKGNSKALVENKYNFISSDVTYLRKTSDLLSDKNTIIEDKNGSIYTLDKFRYTTNKKLLKAKNLEISTKNADNKEDGYFFSEGIFNLENKKFLSKETQIKIHKDIFGNKNNDPRLYGVSSSGDTDKIVVNKGIFTSCKNTDKIIPWCIKANKITHDKIKKNLIYEKATLKIYDVPVVYFPKFFHPDPTVKRRSGFLQPQFNNSETLGSSIHIPYFKTIGDDQDYTFKPTFFDDKKYILQNEFRKKFKNSSLITDFSLTRGYKSSPSAEKNSIGHLFLNYDHDLKLENYSTSKIQAKIEKVTNDTYLKVFQNNLFKSQVIPDDKDTMESNLNLELDNDDLTFNSGVRIYENLSGENSDRFQFVFPYYEYIQNIYNNEDYGYVNFSSSGDNSLKNTNNLKTIIQNEVQYNSIDYIGNGFKNNFGIYLKNRNIVAKNDTVYSSNPQIDGFSILNLESSYPLAKKNSTKNEFLTPKISFRINPGNNMKNYRNDNKIINANNIFDINRLGISDSYEAGKSITLGLDYKYDLIETKDSTNKKQKDKFLEFKLATVIRDEEEKKIPISSTIDKKNSNIFGSINNSLIDNININYNFSLDNDIQTLDSQNVKTEISINNFLTTFDYIEQNSKLGNTHVLSNTTEYKFNENNFIKFSTRRNKKINLTEYYDLSYEYKNDCLTAALKFNKVFYQDNDLKPSEDLFFTITLVPLTTFEREVYKRNSGLFR